jgi:hypothetical protein
MQRTGVIVTAFAVTLPAIIALSSQVVGNDFKDAAVKLPNHAGIARDQPDLTRRYLAVDRSLHAELQNMRLVMESAQRRQVLWRQYSEPWEAAAQLQLGAIGSVFRDHEGRYRMYYELMLNNEKRATAVAFSDDGIRWHKPRLNLAPSLVDEPASNLIRVDPAEQDEGRGLLNGKWYRGAHAFYDTQAATPEGRYRLLWRQGHDMYVASSKDGLHFKTHGRAVEFYADTSASYFFDDLQQCYVIFGRTWIDKEGRPTIQDRLGADGRPPSRRGVALHRSPRWDATPWPAETVGQQLIDPKDVFGDGGWTDIYTPNVQLYHGQYVALPAVYFRRPADDHSTTLGSIYPIFMHSLDGRTWDFPDKKHSMVALEPHLVAGDSKSEVGMIFPAATLLESDEQLRVFYSARGYQHHITDPERRLDVSFNVAVMRKDGFGSLKTLGEQRGAWRTRMLTVPAEARSLHVNARVAGQLRVSVLDENRNELQSFTAKTCQPITGDRVDHTVAWSETQIEQLRDRKIHLRFNVSKGQIYSFWFR